MTKARKATRKFGIKRKANSRRSAPQDAIALLKADHRQVDAWFARFLSARSGSRQQELAQKICHALKVHTQVEHEIFYPAFVEATNEVDVHHEAEVEHQGARMLIVEIEGSGPEDEYYRAKVKVLSEMIKHHVNEEEKRNGMFAKARYSDMDLDAIGERLALRKSELIGTQAKSAKGHRTVGSWRQHAV